MRPRPVSQLQKPKHSRNITAALSIGSLVKMKQNFATTQKEDLKTRLHATRVQPWQQSKARPIVAATVTGSAAMVVALGIFYAQQIDTFMRKNERHALIYWWYETL